MKRSLISLLIALIFGSLITFTALAQPARDGGGPEPTATATSTHVPLPVFTPTLTATPDLHPAANQVDLVTPSVNNTYQQPIPPDEVTTVTPKSNNMGIALLLIAGIVIVSVAAFFFIQYRKR
jgi:hypothetical protein